MTGHTPGPWKYKVIPSSVHDGEKIHAILMTKGNLNGETVLAKVSDYSWEDLPNATEIAEANARLIAAAPELLEALQIMEAAEDELEIAKALEIGRAAIAHATGEQP